MNQEIKIEDLEKVYVDLPNHWAVGGESMWAKPLENNLYEIHNTPFYSYGLNYLDIVKVDSSDETKKPLVLEVLKASGHLTIRIIFNKEINKNSQLPILDELKNLKIDFERVNDNYVALDIEPSGDYDAVLKRLTELQQDEILEYETCESRVANSFDDTPEEN
jgi:hypothetical protein